MDAELYKFANELPGVGTGTAEQRIAALEEQLYSLHDKLRFLLTNLGAENFNSNKLSELSDAMTGGIKSRVEDAEGNISVLQQTSSSLRSDLTDAEGNISSLQQTASGLTTRVGDAEGNISSLQQTATSLRSDLTSETARASGAENDLSSSIVQTVNSINLSVTGSEGSTTFTLRRGSATIDTETVDLHVKALNVDGTITAGELNVVRSSSYATSSVKTQANNIVFETNGIGASHGEVGTYDAGADNKGRFVIASGYNGTTQSNLVLATEWGLVVEGSVIGSSVPDEDTPGYGVNGALYFQLID